MAVRCASPSPRATSPHAKWRRCAASPIRLRSISAITIRGCIRSACPPARWRARCSTRSSARAATRSAPGAWPARASTWRRRSKPARDEGYDQVTERDDALLAEVVSLLAREAFTGDAPPPAARRMVDAFRPWFDATVMRDLQSLSKLVGDQDSFGRLVRQLIKDLHIEDPEDRSEE